TRVRFALFAPSRLRVFAAMVSLPFRRWVRSRGSAFGAGLQVPFGSFFLLRGADHDVAAFRARHRAAHEEDIVLRPLLHDLQVLDRLAVVALSSRHGLAFPDAAGIGARSDAARPAVHHVAVRLGLARVVVAAHHALEALPLARAEDVAPLAFVEEVEAGVLDFGELLVALEAELEDLALRLRSVRLQVPRLGAGEARLLL